MVGARLVALSRLALALALVLGCGGPAAATRTPTPEPPVEAAAAAGLVGRNAGVRFRVVCTELRDDGLVYLKSSCYYDEKQFRAVVALGLRHHLETTYKQPLATFLYDQMIVVRGPIEVVEGWPQIVVSRAEQVLINSRPLPLPSPSR